MRSANDAAKNGRKPPESTSETGSSPSSAAAARRSATISLDEEIVDHQIAIAPPGRTTRAISRSAAGWSSQ